MSDTETIGPIAASRTWLADRLQGLTQTLPALKGWTVHAYMPELISPPCIITTESDPLVSVDGEPTGHATVTFDLAVITRGTANPDTYPLLDAAVDALITGLYGVCDPGSTSYSIVTTPDGLKYLAARIEVPLSVTL